MPQGNPDGYSQVSARMLRLRGVPPTAANVKQMNAMLAENPEMAQEAMDLSGDPDVSAGLDYAQSDNERPDQRAQSKLDRLMEMSDALGAETEDTVPEGESEPAGPPMPTIKNGQRNNSPKRSGSEQPDQANTLTEQIDEGTINENDAGANGDNSSPYLDYLLGGAAAVGAAALGKKWGKQSNGAMNEQAELEAPRKQLPGPKEFEVEKGAKQFKNTFQDGYEDNTAVDESKTPKQIPQEERLLLEGPKKPRADYTEKLIEGSQHELDLRTPQQAVSESLEAMKNLPAGSPEFQAIVDELGDAVSRLPMSDVQPIMDEVAKYGDGAVQQVLKIVRLLR